MRRGPVSRCRRLVVVHGLKLRLAACRAHVPVCSGVVGSTHGERLLSRVQPGTVDTSAAVTEKAVESEGDWAARGERASLAPQQLEGRRQCKVQAARNERPGQHPREHRTAH